MYIDLIVLIVLICVVVFFFRSFSSVVYFIAMSDILLRILTFVKNNIPLPDVSSLINKYVPENVLAIVSKYCDGVLYTIVSWIFVGIMAVFLFYTARIFWKKR